MTDKIEAVEGHAPTITQPQNPFYLEVFCSCGGYVYVVKSHLVAWWREHTA